ncbi:MAG: helix-turn-helix transcriptional regulator [Peptococcaceae bacterium]|jgi:AraC-like DNA-binding protein|nr:helix-turn-helix transcriptional regulator [Peptococcaceae bacterium]
MEHYNEPDTYSYNYYAQQEMPLDDILIQRLILSGDMPAQKQDGVQILFFQDGEGALNINGLSFSVKPGMLLCALPFHLYSLSAPKGASLEGIRCSFPLSLLMYLGVSRQHQPAACDTLEHGSPLVTLSPEDVRRVAHAFAEMEEESRHRDHYYRNFMLSGLMRILSLFYRESVRNAHWDEPLHRSDGWKALQQIHLYFNKKGFDAVSAAKELGVSTVRLGHTLRVLTGQGFAANLHEVRVRNACAMMRFEELSIAFIARHVGYSSLATFHRVFKEIKGVTPERYRAGASGVTAGIRRDTAWNILVFLLERYADPIKAADAAEYLFIGETTVTRILQANFGMTFPELLERIRLSYACALLGVTDLQIGDIALSVGYNSLRTFNRSFRRCLGTTPVRYRGALSP